MVTARIGALLVAIAVVFPAVAADDAKDTVITWEQASDHVGDDVIVEGRVLGVHCSPLSCLLAFEPTFNRFTAVVQASSFGEFPPDELDRRFNGQRVRVRGKVVERDSKPEVIVGKKEDLTLVGETRREMRERQETVAQIQVETLERVADVLERVEELTERLAAVQERMETLLVAMEEREAALAESMQAMQAVQQAPSPAPGWEPPPRPAFEALRTVKRGTSRAEAERLLGPPQYVESTANGWTTYYYPYGRSISFDTRGRAQALVGFAQ
jgi:hypothetical protein